MSAAPELIAAVAALDAAGGRLRIVDGRLRVDVDQELPEEIWSALAAHRDELLANVAGDRRIWDDAPIWADREGDRAPVSSPDGIDRCDRCGSPATTEHAIHDGRSVRLDCAACGRFRKFTLWHGVVMP